MESQRKRKLRSNAANKEAQYLQQLSTADAVNFVQSQGNTHLQLETQTEQNKFYSLLAACLYSPFFLKENI